MANTSERTVLDLVKFKGPLEKLLAKRVAEEIRKAVEEERETCAKIAEEWARLHAGIEADVALELASQIRARSKSEGVQTTKTCKTCAKFIPYPFLIGDEQWGNCIDDDELGTQKRRGPDMRPPLASPHPGRHTARHCSQMAAAAQMEKERRWL